VPISFFERLVEVGFSGDIDRSRGARTVSATDNSIYQITPAGIVFPRTTEDVRLVAMTLSEPAFRQVIIAPRGGGTGTNGQSLTDGVVVDCSRYLNHVLEIDPVRRVARVQAGVVKDQLNKALQPHGLFFAPELSTSNRATIAGMVSTDACGQGSCVYGKTSNHVLGLRIVLADGTLFWSRPLDNASLEALKGRQDQIGEIHRIVDAIACEKKDLIEEIFPALNRYMTGYDLAHIYRPDGRFDLNAVLCGSEGTLALIAEVEVQLLPIKAHTALVNIRYADFNAALEHARTLVALKVDSVETVDETVLGLAKGDIVWPSIAQYFPQEATGSTSGINIVELLADDEETLEERLASLTAALDTAVDRVDLGYVVARRSDDIEAIWTMRKRAVGLLGSVEGAVRPVAFVEDTAVPPEHLAAYIREFRALLDAEHLAYGMFGHVDAGVLHVRPALDLTLPEHAALVRKISDGVVALTRKYGGVLWGEHGKGVRSEYVPDYFGPLYASLQQIKRAFDPANQLNPGKIATPAGEPLLKIDQVELRGSFDRAIGQDIRSSFDNAAFCNGNGACFDFDETGLMCPSYKATRDRRHSPKGRASLMREWLRQIAQSGHDPRKEADSLRVRNPFMAFLARTANSLDPRNRNDFSHEVRAAMDTCLSCKACAGQCPVKVSVPAFRAKFMELYYGRYLRPLKHSIVSAIESALPAMASMRPAYNLLVGTIAGKALLRGVGLTALPEMPRLSFRQETRRLGVEVATPRAIRALTPDERHRVVVLVADVFSAHFDPMLVGCAIELVRKLGFTPYLAPSHRNGKPLHVHGFLGRFQKTAAQTALTFQQLADLGVALVGIDPSMTLVFRSEYKSALGPKMGFNVLLPQEWLAENIGRVEARTSAAGAAPREAPGPAYTLMLHCTERTNAPASAAQWKLVFEHLGIDVEIGEVGCCGMAGTFGHEVSNRAISERLYAMSWAGQVSRDRRTVLATGYSCRSQVKSIDRRVIQHPLAIIERLLSEMEP
jgi:FAD/FMN-containing dehydrogenase/Fe-S oxidoreductase